MIGLLLACTPRAAPPDPPAATDPFVGCPLVSP
jgi:hypothetical protein